PGPSTGRPSARWALPCHRPMRVVHTTEEFDSLRRTEKNGKDGVAWTFMIQTPTFSALLLVARMADIRHVLAGATLLGSFLVANGAYIIVFGRIGPNLGKRPESGRVLSSARRLWVASPYIVFGAAIL